MEKKSKVNSVFFFFQIINTVNGYIWLATRRSQRNRVPVVPGMDQVAVGADGHGRRHGYLDVAGRRRRAV